MICGHRLNKMFSGNLFLLVVSILSFDIIFGSLDASLQNQDVRHQDQEKGCHDLFFNIDLRLDVGGQCGADDLALIGELLVISLVISSEIFQWMIMREWRTLFVLFRRLVHEGCSVPSWTSHNDGSSVIRTCSVESSQHAITTEFDALSPKRSALKPCVCLRMPPPWMRRLPLRLPERLKPVSYTHLRAHETDS